MSNNVAEYAGCIAVMKYLIANQISEAVIRGDSKMVVRQMSGRMKAKGGMYLPFWREAKLLRAKLPKVRFEHIRREFNSHADWLSRQAIREVPRAPKREAELRKLIAEQKADMKQSGLKFPRPVRVIKREAWLNDPKLKRQRAVGLR